MTMSTKHCDSEECAVEREEKPNIDGDRLNLCLLLILYVIQGFPIGFALATSNILQSKKSVTYEDQAIFSMALWPHWMKLLWAPIIDAFYVQKIGRRKSWLLPLQILIGLFLLFLANNIEDWLPVSGKPNLKMLAYVILTINFLSATQDIVVDGWSLTMLKKNNVSYASTCNTVGVPFGMFIGSVCFTLLVSEEFNNKYFRTIPGEGGIISIKTYLYACAIFILSISILIGIFKKEKDNRLEDGFVKTNILQNYKLLWDVLHLPRVQILAVALLTMRIGFTAMDNSVSHLMLIDAGVSKDDIMIITTGVYILQFSMPFLVSKYITSSKPMSYYMNITPIRLLWAIAYAVLIFYTPSLIHKNNVTRVPIYYYFILGLVVSVNEVMSIFMLLTLFAFFYRLSDPRFGGTYMTLYNTFFFLGFLVSNTFVLKIVDLLTFSKCSNNIIQSCSTPDLKNMCETNAGKCEVYINGYYIAVVICMVIGFIWYSVFKNIIKSYQLLGLSHWLVGEKLYKTTAVNEF